MSSRFQVLTAVALLYASAAYATDLQGVLADWDCTQEMVQNGRAKTLKKKHSCSLDHDYSRGAYGLITDDKRFFKLDDAGRDWALKLLKGSPDKNNLHVIVSGDLEGNLVHVQTMSEL
jgi:dTDP-4-dehydrorhamnose 3,5-epimerase-like enzyme